MDLEGPAAHRQVGMSGHISLSCCYYSRFKSHRIWKGQETKCSLDRENASMIHDNHEFSTLTFATTMCDSKLCRYYAKPGHVALVLRTPNKWCTINRTSADYMMHIQISQCPPAFSSWNKNWVRQCFLPGGSPVMSCTVQQGAHICLVSPSNVDHQHACETRNLFCVNYDHNANYTEKKKKTQQRMFYSEIHI